MNWLFRRHFWLVHLFFLSVIAVILGRTITTVASYWLLKAVGEKMYVKPLEKSIKESLFKNYEIANERNLFMAKREHVSLLEEPEEDSDPGRWQDAGPSSLPLKLVSIMFFSDPFSSRAVVANLKTNKAKVYSIAECAKYRKIHSSDMETVLPSNEWQPDVPCNSIEGIALVRRIEEFRIYIFNERDRRWEYLSLMGEEKRARRPIVQMPESEDLKIRKIGEHSYEVDQSELDKALSNVAKLMTEARALPKTDANGNVLGFEIVYLKPQSLFEKIGILKNDLLTRINGYDLSSLEKALELFSKLRYSDRFTIDLKRGDRPITLDYTVVR